MAAETYQSWGRYPASTPHRVLQPTWSSDDLKWADIEGSVLTYGAGRSQGDVCLNNGGTLVDTKRWQHFLQFDDTQGIIRCEAGVTLADILALTVPRGWFLRVTPGTKLITVGGAVANDVHGKNHHRAGTFGAHVRQFELLRSNGSRTICSPTDNADLFRATIGGLGLTGIITWVEISLLPITSPYLTVGYHRFNHIRELLEQADRLQADHEYVVGWFDSLGTGTQLGRGVLMTANHLASAPAETKPWQPPRKKSVPFNAPSWLINPVTVQAYNHVHWWRYRQQQTVKEDYETFFYPLDSVLNWNRIYGAAGFLQYQCIIPPGPKQLEYSEKVLQIIAESRQGSFLSTIKIFADKKSPGILSFPKAGLELAVDFAYQGQKTHDLFNQLDTVVLEAGGRVYPAKDAHISETTYKEFFPQWSEFKQYIDPKFSSSFARRVGLV